MADRAQDFMTIFLDGELIVLPCANLDQLLGNWLADDGRAFTHKPWILLDDVAGAWDQRVTLNVPPPQPLTSKPAATPAMPDTAVVAKTPAP